MARAENSVTIKFKPEGHERLIAAINKLDRATKKLQSQTKKQIVSSGTLDVAFHRNVKSAGLLGNAFSTLRSKMLIAAFAIATFVRPLKNLAAESAKVKSLEKAFTDLMGGIGHANEALNKLQDATNNTVSNFDLFQQANNAMILGVTKNTDEMAEMFDMAQRLGEAVGRDATSSVESLIVGLGRQSRLMLDNIGIVVKADLAYEQLANKLNTTVDKLSESQKRTAFFNATLDSARKKLKDLSSESNTMLRDFERLSASMRNLAVPYGKFINFLFGDLLRGFSMLGIALEDIFTVDQIEKMNRLKSNLQASRDAFIQVEGRTRKAQRALLDFYFSIAQAPKDLSKDLVDTEGFSELNQAASNLLKNLEKLPEKNMVFIESINKIKPETAATIMAIDSMSSALAEATLAGDHLGMAVEKSLKRIAAQITAKAGVYALLATLFSGAGLATGFGASLKFALGIAHTGGLIKDNKVQKFATGGVVEGQDNVPILAQNGEFVMSRRAVESVGIETMNRINQTGSAGVNITLNNPIMTQDFVENDLAEAIKEAARKGADFGIS